MSKVSVFPLPLDQYPHMSQFIEDNKSACICAQYRQDPEFASFKNVGVYPAIMRFYGSNVATLITRFKEDILPLETKNTKCRGHWFGTSETLVNAKDSAKFIKSVKSGKKDAEIEKGSLNEIPSSHPSSSAPTGSSFTQGEEKRTSSAFVPRGHGALPSIMHMVAEVDWTPTPVQTQDHLSASTQPLSRPASVLAPSPAPTSISATLSDLQDPASRYQHLMASNSKPCAMVSSFDSKPSHMVSAQEGHSCSQSQSTWDKASPAGLNNQQGSSNAEPFFLSSSLGDKSLPESEKTLSNIVETKSHVGTVQPQESQAQALVADGLLKLGTQRRPQRSPEEVRKRYLESSDEIKALKDVLAMDYATQARIERRNRAMAIKRQCYLAEYPGQQ